jgi:murein L,D-transpeptidase YcbB/YkuD
MRSSDFFLLMVLPAGLALILLNGAMATEASAPQSPITNIAPDTQGSTVEKLRALIEKDLVRYVTRKEDHAAVAAFYRDRGFAPLWSQQGLPTAAAKEAMAFLQRVEADGLDPADYPIPDFANAAPNALAEDDLKLTGSVLAFARHAQTGRVSFTRVSGAIFYDQVFPNAAEVLSKMASGSVSETLDSFNPPHPGYKALKAKLAEQRRSRPDSIGILLANMERWRWLPRSLGTAHVLVNVPDYTLRIVNDGKPIWSTRLVVGKPGELATPLLSETIKYITVNPTWNVPPSIIRNEYLPALQSNPNALSRLGLKASRNPDGSLRLYQPPGSRNALGRIRFNFPNKFLVYQHDTPSKHLFDRKERAFSHGCMRVQNPEHYAEVLLSLSQKNEAYTAERIRKLYGDDERTINLKSPIPVHITYQTAFVDDAGELQTRRDVYGRDKEVLALLRGNDRRVADIPIARNYSSSSKPVMASLPSRRPSRSESVFMLPRNEFERSYGFR